MKTYKQKKLEQSVRDSAEIFANAIVKNLENLGARPSGKSVAVRLEVDQSHILQSVRDDFKEVYHVKINLSEDFDEEEHFMYCVSLIEDMVEDRCGQIVKLDRCHPRRTPIGATNSDT